jgi:hypothetical protein
MSNKLHASLYEGSMIGAGAMVFAVWGYVIARMDSEYTVELNPKLMAFTLGETEESVNRAIAYLCAPDPNSRSQEQGGRRLLPIEALNYHVVNGAKYQELREQDSRRARNRINQQNKRERDKAITTITAMAEPSA